MTKHAARRWGAIATVAASLAASVTGPLNAQIPTPEVSTWLAIEQTGVTGWALIGEEIGGHWVPGLAIVCTESNGAELTAFLGSFPTDRRPVQLAVRTPTGEVERYGPVVRAGPESGFHDPKVTGPTEVLRFARAALRAGSLISNGYNSFWNAATRG